MYLKVIAYLCISVGALPLSSQSISSGTVIGTASDSTGGRIAGASVRLANGVVGFERSTVSDASGAFRFDNVPLNNYRLHISASGFSPVAQDLEIRSQVPITLNVVLEVASSSTSLTVESTGARVETDPSAHQDVDQSSFLKLPVFDPAGSLSQAVTYSTGGVAADANGFFHPLGDHAQTTFVIDGQPISDQRRIVERVEGLWTKAALLDGLNTSVAAEVEMLLAAEEMRIWPNDALQDAPPLQDATVYLARGRQSEQGDSQHYLIKTQHVQDRNYVRSRLTLAPHIAAKVAPEALAQPNDILIACSAAGCLGRIAFFQADNQVASTDTHVAIARANRERILPEYLYAYLRGAQGKCNSEAGRKATGSEKRSGFGSPS